MVEVKSVWIPLIQLFKLDQLFYLEGQVKS